MPRHSPFIRNMMGLFGLLLLMACRPTPHSETIPEISFYYWKTVFALNAYEQSAIQQQGVTRLFTRFFDVDIPPGDSLARPISALQWTEAPPPTCTIVPVVYIKNRVFEQTDSIAIPNLCAQIAQLVAQIAAAQDLSINNLQFDCDWTDSTRDRFFYFLQQYRQHFPHRISATIRLHQIKYAQRTGVPPVDEGVLMFYNMGTIKPTGSNSIYNTPDAARYVAALPHYPLELSLALPIFSWAIQSRNDKVVQLLNKTYLADFTADTNFAHLGGAPALFEAKRALFKGGYYFKAGDRIKVEHISPTDLQDMTQLLGKHLDHRPPTIIFYDLDSLNLIQYDHSIFKQIGQNIP